MRLFTAHTLSGLLIVTALFGCKKESKSLENTDDKKNSSLVLQAAEFEKTPAQTTHLPPGQRCFYDLCNDTIKQVPNILLTIKKASAPSAAQEAYYQQYVEPVLAKYSQALQQRDLTLLSVLEEKESRFTTTNLNQAQLRLVYLVKAIKDPKNNPELKDYWTTTYLSLDFNLAFMTFQQFGKFSYFQRLYPNKELADAYIQELTKINSILPRVTQDVEMEATVIPTELQEKIKSRQALTIDETEELSALSNGVRMLSHYLYEDGVSILDKLIAAKPVNSSELFNDYKKSAATDKLRQRSAKIRTLPHECKTRFYQSINLYPQQSEIDKFKGLAENARTAALSQLRQQDPAFKRIESLKFVLPASAEENTKSYLRALNSKYRDVVQTIEQYKSMSDAAAFTLSLFNAIDPGEGIDCNSTPSAEISDKTVPSDGFLLVSWFSVRYPQVGLSILSHEIGHTVFAYSNGNNISRQCLTEKQSGSDKYLNEDYADVFAAKNNIALMTQFNFKPLNYGCSLVLSSADTNLINMDSEDPHTTGFYRAIQLTVHGGQKLPASCQQILQGDFQTAGRECL